MRDHSTGWSSQRPERRDVRRPVRLEVTRAPRAALAATLVAAAVSPRPASAEATPERSAESQESQPTAPTQFRGRSAWGFDARHRERDVSAGRLYVDTRNAITTQAGATFGLIPELVVPRYDLTTRGALFLTEPGGEQDLLGVWKLRLSALGGVTHESPLAATDVAGASFGMSLCLAPAYDSDGWVVLACAEYGGGVMGFDVREPGGREASSDAGFGTVGLGLDVEYNLGSLVHIGLSGGWDAYLGSLEARTRDGRRMFAASSNTLRASLALGVHF